MITLQPCKPEFPHVTVNCTGLTYNKCHLLTLPLSVMSPLVSNRVSYFLLIPQGPQASIKPSVIQLWQFFHPARYATWKLIPWSRKLCLTSKLWEGTALALPARVALGYAGYPSIHHLWFNQHYFTCWEKWAEISGSLFLLPSLGREDVPHANCCFSDWRVLEVWRA